MKKGKTVKTLEEKRKLLILKFYLCKSRVNVQIKIKDVSKTAPEIGNISDIYLNLTKKYHVISKNTHLIPIKLKDAAYVEINRYLRLNFIRKSMKE